MAATHTSASPTPNPNRAPAAAESTFLGAGSKVTAA